jgi:O-antigen/teichoic acid export membrane protein
VTSGASGLDPHRTARATAFAVAATAIDKGGAMLLLLVIARTLGAEDFGRYAALMALLTFVQLGAEFGQEPVLVRLLAQGTGGDTQRLVGGAMAMRLAFTTIGGALLIVVGARLLPIGAATLALAAGGLVATSGAVLRAVFRTEQRLDRLCIVALVNVTTFASALAIARAWQLGLGGAVAAWSVGQLGSSLTATALARRMLPVRPRWHTVVTATLARSGWALALNALLLTVTFRVGQLIVVDLLGAEQGGYLAAGSRLAEGFALVPEPLMLVLLPAFAAYDVAARGAQRALGVRVVRWLGVFALAVIVAASTAAPTLVALLFGVRYLPAVPVLRVSIWLALLAATGSVFTNLLIARGLERVLLAANAVSSLVTIAASLVVVPRLGFVGAAAVSLAASLLAQLLLALFPPTRADVLACIRPLRAPFALALACVLVGRLLPGPPLATASIATLSFIASSLAVGALGMEDVRLLRDALGRSRRHPD